MLEKDPSSYLEESQDPSDQGTQDQFQRKKLVKKISKLNESFEDGPTKKKSEPISKIRGNWLKNFEKSKISG